MAEYIAASTAASNGADFTVSTAVGVSCYGFDGMETVGIVMKKNSDATYEPLKSRIEPDRAPVEVRLSGNQPDFTITKPGTYRIEKFATVGTVGIDTDGS